MVQCCVLPHPVICDTAFVSLTILLLARATGISQCVAVNRLLLKGWISPCSVSPSCAM